jgi:hypothetical protein
MKILVWWDEDFFGNGNRSTRCLERLTYLFSENFVNDIHKAQGRSSSEGIFDFDVILTLCKCQ